MPPGPVVARIYLFVVAERDARQHERPGAEDDSADAEVGGANDDLPTVTPPFGKVAE